MQREFIVHGEQNQTGKRDHQVWFFNFYFLRLYVLWRSSDKSDRRIFMTKSEPRVAANPFDFILVRHKAICTQNFNENFVLLHFPQKPSRKNGDSAGLNTLSGPIDMVLTI